MGAKSSSPSTPSRNDESSEFSGKNTSPLLSATLNCTFSIRVESDEENGEVNRMVSLPDDRIFLVDFSTRYLKLYSSNYMLYDAVTLMCCHAVTCVDDDSVAVSTIGPAGSDIILYSLEGNKIRETEKAIHVDGIIYDLAYRHGEFLIRYGNDCHDFIYCGNNCIIKQNREVNGTDFMHYDLDSDLILLGNQSEKTIACYKPNGKMIWKVAINGLPAGITVVQGVVLVADLYVSVIRQITLDGRLLATPVLTEEDGVIQPGPITYQQQKHRLIVNKYPDDTVMTFDISEAQ